MEKFELETLRQKEGPYTEDELAFMYKLHNQETYKIENIQHSEHLYQNKEGDNERNPGKWGKYIKSRMNEDQKKIFDELRATLKEEGHDYLSDNFVMRNLGVRKWDIERAYNHI